MCLRIIMTQRDRKVGENGREKYTNLVPNISPQLIYLHVLMQLVVSSDPDWTDCDRHEDVRGHTLQPFLSLVVYILMSKQHPSTSLDQLCMRVYTSRLVTR